MDNPNERLQQFTGKEDNELSNGTGGNANTFTPQADIFNSAGNTNLSEDDKDEPKEDDRPKEETPTGKVSLGKVISGKNAIAMVNIFIPSFVVFSFRRFGYATNKQAWKLNKEEQETMQPIVQQCLDYIIINFDNPFYALAFVASMIYGAKAFDAIPELSKMKDEALEEDKPTTTISTPTQTVNSNNSARYKDYKDRILATSVRKEKNKIIVEALELETPKDMIEAAKTYLAIFPERTEGYFHEWYEKNIELMPNSLRFDGSISSPNPADHTDFNLE